MVVLSEVIGSYGSELKATVGSGMSGSFPAGYGCCGDGR